MARRVSAPQCAGPVLDHSVADLFSPQRGACKAAPEAAEPSAALSPQTSLGHDPDTDVGWSSHPLLLVLAAGIPQTRAALQPRGHWPGGRRAVLLCGAGKCDGR